MSSLDDEDPSLLLIVLDASTAFWSQREVERMRQDQAGKPPLLAPTFQEAVEATLLFLEGYLMMHRRNDICFVVCSACESSIVYPTDSVEQEQRSLPQGTVSSKEFQEYVTAGIERVLEREKSRATGSLGSGCLLDKGLSKGLCYLNRKLQDRGTVQARALIMSGAPDMLESYNSFMNCIFSAQKAGVLVDCSVLGEHSTFLQQAAYLTGGTYLQCQEGGLAQYLVTTFLPSQSCRKYLKLRKQQTVDFRAACFCHKKVVDIAFVCSVCLSVFCEFSPVCSTCGTRAWPKRPAQSKKRRLTLPSS
ncbi:unnamed protein product [Discosporangium mesarthrocarpum]